VYDFSAEWLSPQCADDPWLRFWAMPAGRPHRKVAKAIVRRLLDRRLPTGRESLDLSRCYFTSKRIREIFVSKGFPVAGAAIIYRGVDLRRFHPVPRRFPDGPLRLLFAGRLTKDKGLHTVIEALGLLAKTGAEGRVSLSVAGPEQDAGYAREVHRAIQVSRLDTWVRYLGLIPWDRMPELYHDHEVYLLPSIFEEPFSIGLLEAMASGLPVVGTTAGGSREVLVEGENSLTFPAGDAAALAAQLWRVLDPNLRARLAVAGRRTVEERFPLERILSQIEAFLQDAVAQHRAGRQGGVR
jgi:glycosyltransferase involved in cell wall biosynthesis